jgi:DNA-directed RNA polymerase sigma subunit (sigma70/sigma32)
MATITIDHRTIDVDAAVARYKAAKDTANLYARDMAIFEEKFGVNSGIIKTYLEVGRAFGISKDRVRQLCARVLHKIGLLP